MRSRAHHLLHAAVLLGAASVVIAPPRAARSQIDQPALDHLKCYRIEDSLQPALYVADLRNQFGLEPGCQIGVPARLFCVETAKRVLPPQPPGGGPSGTPAGHFLCYRVQCPTTAIAPAQVEDQFGRRTIRFLRERILCAPADKLICGDGDIDPGEQCDPGSAATNVCPGGTPCNADCTCPTGVCCQCPDTCVNASGTVCPSDCAPVAGAVCEDNVCQTCPCGQPCTDAAGNVGECRQTDLASPVCECVSPPCECGTGCLAPDGQPGTCQPIPGSTDCRCQPQCPCGQPCTNAAGEVGTCRPGDTSNVCECRVPPNPCPCGATCLTNDGAPGTCQMVAGSDQCRCRKQPPPECPCDATCTLADGTVGRCARVAGNSECRCTPPPSECPCGKTCVGANGLPGRCRTVHGAPGTCACVEG